MGAEHGRLLLSVLSGHSRTRILLNNHVCSPYTILRRDVSQDKVRSSLLFPSLVHSLGLPKILLMLQENSTTWS